MILTAMTKTYVSISWGISSKSSRVLWFASNVWFIFLFSNICSAEVLNSLQPEVSLGISLICKPRNITISFDTLFYLKSFTWEIMNCISHLHNYTEKNKGSKSRKQANSFAITTAACKGEYIKYHQWSSLLKLCPKQWHIGLI